MFPPKDLRWSCFLWSYIAGVLDFFVFFFFVRHYFCQPLIAASVNNWQLLLKAFTKLMCEGLYRYKLCPYLNCNLMACSYWTGDCCFESILRKSDTVFLFIHLATHLQHKTYTYLSAILIGRSYRVNENAQSENYCIFLVTAWARQFSLNPTPLSSTYHHLWVLFSLLSLNKFSKITKGGMLNIYIFCNA